MQQFVVPQFIDVENRIFGPITVRQFIIMLVAGLFMFIAYKLSDFTLFIVETIFIVFFFGIFAFFKVNGQPLHYFLLNLIQTLIKPNVRLWHKIINQDELKIKINTPSKPLLVRPNRKQFISTTRLEELSLIIDTGGVYRGEE